MKTLICPQCGGMLNLTQYPGVYHCRYCRALVESDVQALREIEVRERELALREQSLLDVRIVQMKRAQKVQIWQTLCHIWWGFIALTFLMALYTAFWKTSLTLPLSEVISLCLTVRVIGSPVVTFLRPDNCYEVYDKPACSQGVLLFLFWFADMFEWVFVVLALTS